MQPDDQNQTAEAPQIPASIRYSRVVGFSLFFVVLGAWFYHVVEHLRWLDAFYFTVITLATVGYGDIVPHTDAGKIFTIFYVFVGIVIFAFLARIIVTETAHRQRNKIKQRRGQRN